MVGRKFWKIALVSFGMVIGLVIFVYLWWYIRTPLKPHHDRQELAKLIKDRSGIELRDSINITFWDAVGLSWGGDDGERYFLKLSEADLASALQRIHSGDSPRWEPEMRGYKLEIEEKWRRIGRHDFYFQLDSVNCALYVNEGWE